MKSNCFFLFSLMVFLFVFQGCSGNKAYAPSRTIIWNEPEFSATKEVLMTLTTKAISDEGFLIAKIDKENGLIQASKPFSSSFTERGGWGRGAEIAIAGQYVMSAVVSDNLLQVTCVLNTTSSKKEEHETLFQKLNPLDSPRYKTTATDKSERDVDKERCVKEKVYNALTGKTAWSVY